MAVTLNIILDVLSSYSYQNYIGSNEKRDYSSVSILPPTPDDMSTDVLYVCRLSEALKYNIEASGFHYLCVRDRIEDNRETKDTLNGLIIINENMDIGMLFSIVQKQILKINSWISQMKTACINNCDYQKLMDLSEPIIQNAVYVIDSTYSLVAYTKNNVDDEEINQGLLERGYHSEEMLKALREHGLLKIYKEEYGIIKNQPGKPIKYSTMSKWLRSGGSPLIHIVMVCNIVEQSSYLEDLFQILLEYCTICFQREQEQGPGASQIYASLIKEMVYENLINPRIIAERAKCVDIPLNGFFDVYRIVFHDNSSVPVGRFVRDLFLYLPDAKIVAHHYEVIILNSYTSNKVRELSAYKTQSIHHLLERYDAICGISEPFDDFRGLNIAYIQATRAAAIGEKLVQLPNCWGLDTSIKKQIDSPMDSYAFYYGDIYIYYLISIGKNGSFDLFYNTAYNTALTQLMEYDKRNNTNNTQILYVYLISERRTTITGELLHMHRNTVMYRVSKIEEMLNLDLNDHWVRFKLLVAFRCLEIQHFPE